MLPEPSTSAETSPSATRSVNAWVSSVPASESLARHISITCSQRALRLATNPQSGGLTGICDPSRSPVVDGLRGGNHHVLRSDRAQELDRLDPSRRTASPTASTWNARACGSIGIRQGNIGAVLLYRDVDDDRTEVRTLSLWRSREDIVAFAGRNIEAAVFYPEDETLLDRPTDDRRAFRRALVGPAH